MPYLDKTFTKKVRNELKEKYPNFKFSVRTVDHMCLQVKVVKGPLDLSQAMKNPESGYEQVNHSYVSEHYSEFPEVKEFLTNIVSIMKQEQYELVYDGDYGSVPSYYVNLSIGDWDKPYIHQ